MFQFQIYVQNFLSFEVDLVCSNFDDNFKWEFLLCFQLGNDLNKAFLKAVFKIIELLQIEPNEKMVEILIKVLKVRNLNVIHYFCQIFAKVSTQIHTKFPKIHPCYAKVPKKLATNHCLYNFTRKQDPCSYQIKTISKFIPKISKAVAHP